MRRAVAVVLGALCLIRVASGGEERFKKFLSVELALSGNTFWRGEQYPVRGMAATVTITNQSPEGTPIVIARPQVGVREVCSFEIRKAGADAKAPPIGETVLACLSSSVGVGQETVAACALPTAATVEARVARARVTRARAVRARAVRANLCDARRSFCMAGIGAATP